MNEDIKISVCVMTYNQRNYIEQCVQSLLNQNVDVPYEIIIADDASSDGTQEILVELMNKFPKKVFAILREKNIGVTKNYLDMHRRASGNIVFHMDGDDIAYPDKLKVQYYFFQENEDLVCCWHRCDVFNDSNEILRVREANLESLVDPYNITMKDAVKWGVLGCHSSMAYKKEFFERIPIPQGDILDVFVASILLSQGKGVNLPDILGGYRENIGSSTMSNKKKVLFFKPTSSKHIHYENFRLLLELFPDLNKEVFLNSVFNFAVDVKNLRFSCVFLAIKLMIKSFPVGNISFGEIRDHIKKKYKYSKGL